MSRRTLFAFLGALVVATLLVPGLAEAGRRGRWELLGQTQVTDRLDHDRIVVTAGQGTFRSIKLTVLDHAVQFREVKLHFGNGGSQTVALRDLIRAGGESRVIDVEGAGDRVIQSIELTYDAQTLGGKTARVRVFGKN